MHIKQFLLVIVTFVSISLSQSIYAITSPQQDSYPSFENDTYISTTAPNGQVFSSGFTFSGWFKFNKLNSNQTRVIGYNWDSLGIDSTGDNSLTVWVKQNSLQIPSLALNQWINLTVTISGTQVKLYLDGILVEEIVLDEPSFSFPLEEGNNFSVGNFWGHAKQLKLWDRTLSDEELQQAITSVNSQALSPLHQWLMDEGLGFELANTGTSQGTSFLGSSFYWSNSHSPYTLLPDSRIQLFGDQKLIPEGGTAGSADFDQDGIKEVFFHGTIDEPEPPSTPMLIYKVVDGNRLVDVSDTLIDGGLYERVFPTARKTIVTDLNTDGYDDIFYVTSSGHGEHIVPEPSALLLSQGQQGKMFPAHGNIKMPPCTLNGPAYEGQKPCLTSTESILYPDENAELVDFDIRTYGHGAAMADIDRDGDMDLYSQNYVGDELPISSYFLINDGDGNFVANWQMVPHKVFRYWAEIYHSGELNGELKDLLYSFSVMDDYDGDGYVDMALTGSITKAAQLMPPATPFSVETEYPWRSVYELIAWGNKDGFSEEYSILESNLPDDLSQVIKDTHTAPLSIDIDNDGDKDLIVGRNNRGYDIEAFYLQVFRNEGGRIFVDKTAELIPQDADYVITTGKKWAQEIKPYDFNNDGCMDFLLMAHPVFAQRANSNVTQPFRIWINNCAGYFSPAKDSFFGKMGTLLSLDIDDDGGLDFVTTTGGNSSRGNTVISYILKQTGPVEIDYFIDTDRDGLLDSDDADDDGDGVADIDDAFSKIASETTDTDGDGIGNNRDTDDDGDGMSDQYELDNGLNPLLDDRTMDADEDGLTNFQEFEAGTNPQLVDTDSDGLTDFEELTVYQTNPLAADTDNDGMSDAYEISEGLNPLDGGDCPSWMCGSSKTWMWKLMQQTPITGTWRTTDDPDYLLLLSFADDGTYLLAEIDPSSLDEEKGMEWGTWSRSKGTGRITAAQTFDSNSDFGLTDFLAGSSAPFLYGSVSENALTATIDEDGDGSIDDTVNFTRQSESGILGTWVNKTSTNALLMLIFMDDGTYIHAEVEPDNSEEISGMEYGSWSRDSGSGLMTITQTFDENGDTGLSGVTGVEAPHLYVDVSGDTLTVTVDEDGDGTIDDTTVFERQ